MYPKSKNCESSDHSSFSFSRCLLVLFWLRGLGKQLLLKTLWEFKIGRMLQKVTICSIYLSVDNLLWQDLVLTTHFYLFQVLNTVRDCACGHLIKYPNDPEREDNFSGIRLSVGEDIWYISVLASGNC